MIQTSPSLEQVGRVLAAELERLYGLRPKPSVVGFRGSAPGSSETMGSEGGIELLLIDSPERRERLTRWSSSAQWPPPRNPEEGDLLWVDKQNATILVSTARGSLYGCLTFVQLMEPKNQKQAPVGDDFYGPKASAEGPQYGRPSTGTQGAGPANSVSPYNTHLALEKLPRDIMPPGITA